MKECCMPSPVLQGAHGRVRRCAGVWAGVMALLFWAMTAHAEHLVHKAEPGDTLMGIASALLANPEDWRELQRINRVSDPKRIPVGTELRIPLALLSPIPRSAQVEAVAGDARVDGFEAGAGQRVSAGSELETGDDGSMAITLPDGSVLMLPPRTQLRIDRLQGYAGSQAQSLDVSLQRGRVESVVAPQRGPSARYRVDTPTAVIGVRGTDFRAAFDADEKVTRAEVVSGEVSVSSGARQPRARSLSAGFGLMASADGRLSTNIALLPAPDMNAIPDTFDRLPVRLRLPGLPAGVQAWRVRLLPFEVPASAWFDTRTAETDVRVGDLPDGRYRLRLRAVDENGLEGFEAEKIVTLKARPEPPFISQPHAGQKLPEGRMYFTWTQAPEAQSYVFEVVQGRDEGDFARAMATGAWRHQGETEDSAVAVRLGAGEHVWRVASVRANGERGPWSVPVPFVVRPEMAVGETRLLDEHRLLFRWAGEAGQQFDYQFAQDALFARLLAEGRLSEPELVLERPAPDTYFMRIRAIDADGYVSPWSGVQRVVVPSSRPWWMLLAPLLIL